MVLQGFVEEGLLNKMFLANDITELDYVKHHSQDMLDAYNYFIEEEELPDNAASAAMFMDVENISYGGREIEEDSEEDDSEEQEKDNDSMSVAIYNKWVQEKNKVDILFEGCEEAELVTLWRYNNPVGDMDECADKLLIDKATVEKWWDTIDFINGSLGGGRFKLVNPSQSNIKSVIEDAVLQASIDGAQE